MNRLSVLFVLYPFALRVCGQVIYADPLSTSCSTGGPLLGNSIYCCDGLCLGNTHIGSPGKCVAWLDLCSDIDTAPSCGPNQDLSYGDPANVQSGDGCCGACCCECQYMRNNWSWSCCDCPESYIAVTGGRCGGSPSCVGCGGALQTLTGDEHTGFQCVETPPPPNSCDTAKTVDDAVNKIGDWITKVGSLCPLNELPAAISTLGQLLYVDAGSFTENGNGFGTAVTSAFSGILVAAAIVAGGEAGLTVAAGLAEAYETACGALGFIGPAAFVAGVAMDTVTRVECGSNTKRFIPRSSSPTSPTVSNNPCSEFQSIFRIIQGMQASRPRWIRDVRNYIRILLIKISPATYSISATITKTL
ncbi:hypothetical protein N7523_001094 [Penicillium sp. IBT 18751x]|nr:hypothetical protein N7523_001094 [Penicillium sp. IBT 18751x]